MVIGLAVKSLPRKLKNNLKKEIFKSVKITKRMLKDPIYLLRKAGAVHGKFSYPWHVIMNPKDYKQLYRNVKISIKKEFPYLRAKKINFEASMYLFGYGPSTDEIVSEGWLMVFHTEIRKEIEEHLDNGTEGVL